MSEPVRITDDGRSLSALPPFYSVVHLARTGSTNDEAHRLAARGAPEGTLVWADSQDAGRGRRGRLWRSPPGNLYISVVLRPAVPLARFGQLGFAAALAIAETAAGVLPSQADIRCKWPNDVLIGGRKVAGLLLEAEAGGEQTAAWLVLGVGINVASHPSETDFPATSLAAEDGQAAVAAVLAGFAGRFLAWYETWRVAGFAPLRQAWLGRAAGLGAAIQVRLESGMLDGVFGGLDEDGALLLHSPEPRGEGTAIRRISAGDVFFPSRPMARQA